MCLACSAHEAQAYGRRFRRRDSVWTAAICRRFFPRVQAKPPLIRPCREQKRQQAGALQTLARDTGEAILEFASHPAGKLGARFFYRQEKISLTVVIVPAKRGTIDLPLSKENSSPDSLNDSIRARRVDISQRLSSAGE